MKEERTEGKPLFTPSEMWDKDMRVYELEKEVSELRQELSDLKAEYQRFRNEWIADSQKPCDECGC